MPKPATWEQPVRCPFAHNGRPERYPTFIGYSGPVARVSASIKQQPERIGASLGTMHELEVWECENGHTFYIEAMD